jgi:hypothetical protein
MRRVLIELMQILGFILVNKHLNKCDVKQVSCTRVSFCTSHNCCVMLQAAFRLLEPLLQSPYETPDEVRVVQVAI